MDSWADFLSIGEDERPLEGFLRECVELVPRLEERSDELDLFEILLREDLFQVLDLAKERFALFLRAIASR